MGRRALVVVVVDDEADLRWLICQTLEEEGYEVESISDPRAALNLDHIPSLFLVDLMLPGMTGIDLARRLRQDRFSSVPMIAMSASGSMLATAADSELFERVLPKPFDLEVLLDTVQEHSSPGRSA